MIRSLRIDERLPPSQIRTATILSYSRAPLDPARPKQRARRQQHQVANRPWLPRVQFHFRGMRQHTS